MLSEINNYKLLSIKTPNINIDNTKYNNCILANVNRIIARINDNIRSVHHISYNKVIKILKKTKVRVRFINHKQLTNKIKTNVLGTLHE